MASTPQAHAAPAGQQPDVATKQRPSLVPAAEAILAKQQQPQPRMLPETQGVTDGQILAALANVRNFADMYPGSQAEPVGQVPAHGPTMLPEQAPGKLGNPGQPQVRQHSCLLGEVDPLIVVDFSLKTAVTFRLSIKSNLDSKG